MPSTCVRVELACMHTRCQQAPFGFHSAATPFHLHLLFPQDSSHHPLMWSFLTWTVHFPLFQETLPLPWQPVSCNLLPKWRNWEVFCHNKMRGLWPFHVDILMLMRDLASCRKHGCFVNKAYVLISLKNKLFRIFHTLLLWFLQNAGNHRTPTAASIFQLSSGVRLISMYSLLQPLSPLSPAAT